MELQSLIAELLDRVDEEASTSQSATADRLPRQLHDSKTKLAENELMGTHDICDSALESRAVPGSADTFADRSPAQCLSFNLHYKDLSVSLRSEQTIELDVCALVAQIAALREHLILANRKLDEANRKIGFLEAQVLIQDEQIRQASVGRSQSIKKARAQKRRSAAKS